MFHCEIVQAKISCFNVDYSPNFILFKLYSPSFTLCLYILHRHNCNFLFHAKQQTRNYVRLGAQHITELVNVAHETK